MDSRRQENLLARINMFAPYIIGIAMFILSKNNFFYWDNISQISIPANWIYDQNLQSFWVPDNETTGHLPFIPYYLATCWKIFTKSLWVSHLAMLPFSIGILLQLQFITKKIFPANTLLQIIAQALIVLETTFLSQLSLLSPDIPMIFFFLWAFNAILSNQKIGFIVALSLMSILHMRGIIAGGGLMLFYIINSCYINKTFNFKTTIAPLILASIIIFIIYGLHYIEKGWLFHNLNSEKWDNSGKFADFNGVLRNTIVFIWHQVDYGRFFLWLISIVFIIKSFFHRKSLSSETLMLSVFVLTQLAVWSPTTILFQNPFGHRYFLPVFIPLILLTSKIIAENFQYRKILYTTCFVILLSGHFWVYPKKLAQSWDGTTAHWGYYKARREMINYLNSTDYNKNNISSFFPNLASTKYIDLDNINDFKFKPSDLDNDTLVLYANTYNTNDHTIDVLFSEDYWQKEKVITRGLVSMILFRKTESTFTPPAP
jgi:hypothetical protein